MKQYLLALWRAEPARVTAAVAYLLVFLAAKAGIVIDEQSVIDALIIGLPILLGGEAARGQVVPVHKLSTATGDVTPDEVSKP